MRVEDLLIQNQKTSSDKSTSAADILAASAIQSSQTSANKINISGVSSDQTGVSTEGLGSSRNIRATDQISYSRKDIDKDKKTNQTAAEKLASEEASGTDARMLKSEMVLASETMTRDDYNEMVSEGFDPEDTDQMTFVNIADKIRISMEKGGHDMSITGGVSDQAIEAVTGSKTEAESVEKIIDRLQQADLPADDDTVRQVASAMKQASEISDSVTQNQDNSSQRQVMNGNGAQDKLTDSQIKYLLNNDPEPTISNVYNAVFGTSSAFSGGAGGVSGNSIDEKTMSQLMPQITSVIEAAGLTADSTQTENAQWLIENDIPVTADNLISLNNLKDGTLNLNEDEVLTAITDAIKEGRQPSDAMLISGYSMMDQARSMYQDISASRSLAETQLVMSVEANFTLVKQGITLDTASLSDIVDKLKDQEQTLGQIIFSGDTSGLSDIFDQTQNALEEFSSQPAYLIGSYKNIETFTSKTLTELNADGAALADRLNTSGSDQAATQSTDSQNSQNLTQKLLTASDIYETMRTEIRRDLGDSIQKAFGNIDEILADIGLDDTDENERAVRILAYNSKEITQESIADVKAADSLVQRTFKNMTPTVITKMIKEDINPLDLSLSDLNDKAEEIKGVTNASDSADDYADFLWKADRTGSLSDEERDSYVGLYRLMNQVIQTDGAAIGQVLYQGSDLTMRNLMTAVRSSKHEGREYTIDDSTGMSQGFDRSVLSITDQAEMAFQLNRTKDARDEITPGRMQNAFSNEDEYMSLTPDELATVLEHTDETDESQEIENEYIDQQIDEIRQAANSEQRVYDILNDAGAADSAVNLNAIQSMLHDRNLMFTRLFGVGGRGVFSQTDSGLRDGDVDLTDELSEEIEDTIRAFGDAVKTPSDLADAEEKLADTAENVMRRAMINDAESGDIDVRGMKQSITQIQTMIQLSENTETYAIPVMFADRLGNMTLKIVRGSDEKKGLVDIAFQSDNTGTVSASFKSDGDHGIIGHIRVDQAAMREAVSGAIPQIISNIQDQTDGSEVTVSVSYDGTVDANEIYNAAQTDFDTTTDTSSEIQTRTLYAIAKGFMDSISQLM